MGLRGSGFKGSEFRVQVYGVDRFEINMEPEKASLVDTLTCRSKSVAIWGSVSDWRVRLEGEARLQNFEGLGLRLPRSGTRVWGFGLGTATTLTVGSDSQYSYI